MRVIAGSARGRPLRAPRGDRTRPTSDRVREAMFNALGSILDWDGCRVLDLFAGTGALGIEALSRGAAHAVFVEQDRTVRQVLQANLRATGLAERAEIVAGDGPALVSAGRFGPVDVAFCDPPYRFDGWPALLAALDAELIVIESDRELDVGDRWGLVRSKRYGSTVVHFARRHRAPHPQE